MQFDLDPRFGPKGERKVAKKIEQNAPKIGKTEKLLTPAPDPDREDSEPVYEVDMGNPSP